MHKRQWVSLQGCCLPTVIWARSSTFRYRWCSADAGRWLLGTLFGGWRSISFVTPDGHARRVRKRRVSFRGTDFVLE